MVARISDSNRINTRTDGLNVDRPAETRAANVRNDLSDNFARLAGDRPSAPAETTTAATTGRMLEANLGSQPFASGSNVSWNNTALSSRPNVGNLEGFDATKLANENHNSAKYICARIFQKYPNTPEGLRQALPEIQRHFPEARIVGSKGDKIDFGNSVCPKTGERLGTIDVIRAAGEGGKAWQWSPDGPAQQQSTQTFASHNGILSSNLRMQDLDPSAARDDQYQWNMIAEFLQQLMAGARAPTPARA